MNSFRAMIDQQNIDTLEEIQSLIKSTEKEIKQKEIIIESLKTNALELIQKLDNYFPQALFENLYNYLNRREDMEEKVLNDAKSKYEVLNDILRFNVIKDDENPWINIDKDNLVTDYNQYLGQFGIVVSHNVIFYANNIAFSLRIPTKNKIFIDNITDPFYDYGRYRIMSSNTDGRSTIAELDYSSYSLEDISREFLFYLNRLRPTISMNL